MKTNPDRTSESNLSGIGGLVQSLREKEDDERSKNGGINDNANDDNNNKGMHTLAEMYQVKVRQAERVKKRKEAFQRALDHC